jgi:diketogulonate reductase-like aldo/keto reductase
MHNVDANGASLPALGFGTWELRGGTAQRLVEAALEIGYRHIDTAQMYGNEAEVGAAIAASGIARDELFVTTKIWPDRFRRGVFERSVEESVQRLGLRPDLLLLHWPNPDVPLAETVEALNRVAEQGLTRHIGISNFTTAMIDEAVRLSPRPLATNQVEYHPFLDQDAVLARCRAHGMALTAYTPLARGRVFKDPVLARIGRDHGKGPGQVALRWLVQQEGVVAIPRSSSVEHARTNFEVFDFALSEAEMAEVTALAHPAGRLVSGAGMVEDWDS